MIWLTWRQLRTQAVTVYAAVAAFVVVLALTRPGLIDLVRTHPTAMFERPTPIEARIYSAGLLVLTLAPAVIGTFWGAPMVARELEAGTHRLVWNQTVTRTRWLATKLGVTALAAVGVVGVLALAFSWWAWPIDVATGGPNLLVPETSATRGVAPLGYAVFALVLGVAVGTVLRRTVPAMAVTFAVFTFVQFAEPLWVRPHLVPPAWQAVTTTGAKIDTFSVGDAGTVRVSLAAGGRGDWVLSNEIINATGRQVTVMPSWMRDCSPPSDPASGPQPASGPSIESCSARLTREGYRQQVTSQPASRHSALQCFWALQWAETALFLALSGLLTGFCFWWTRHRLA